MAASDLRAYSGIEIEARAIARVVKLLAPAMEKAGEKRPLPTQPQTVPIMHVQCDGTGVPMMQREVRGRKGKAEDGSSKTREVKLGCTFTQHSKDAEGNPIRDPGSTTYVANFQPAEDFGICLRREGFVRGMASAQEMVFIGSGVVEAGCKAVVGKRLTASGMFWSLQGAQNVLTLRTALLSDHFDADWERSRLSHVELVG